MAETRSEHEISHGKYLASYDTELIWGWGTPAGQLRALRRARLISEGASLGPGSLALEIGCGTGLFTQLFAETGARIIAVDISPDLLEKARKRQIPGGKVQFLEKRFEDCDVDGPFDAIIGSSILHHLDFEAALTKIFSLLKPGGVISFAEPNMRNPQVFAERHFRRFFPYTSPDETAFIRAQLAQDLEKAGFHRISITPLDWLHPSSPKVLIPVVQSLGNLLEKIPLVREFAGSLYIKANRPA